MQIVVYCKMPFRKGVLPAKTILIMKLTALIILIATLHVSGKTFSQKVTISGKDLPLSRVFKLISKQTGYEFLYDAQLLRSTHPVDLDLRDQTLTDALNISLKNQGLTYHIKYNTVIIGEGAVQAPTLPSTVDSLPGPIETRGRIMNEKGEPLAGATIIVKGTDKAVMTDNDGRFVIPLKARKAVLIVSFIGYASKEIIISGEHEIPATLLQRSVKTGEEAVVIGYGTIARKNLTGSVASYKPGNEPGALPLSIDNAMVGKLAGVYVAPSSGVPGSANAITIRGISTLNTVGNSPLIVVDGVPIYGIDKNLNTTNFGAGNVQQFAFGGSLTQSDYDASGQLRNTFEKNPLATINPDDIESIDVLKDAYATAIYGSRGAAGVILITTKKGLQGKARIDADVATTFNRPFKLPALMNGDQYAGFYTAYFHAMDSVSAIGNPYYFPRNYIFPKGINTDWLKAIIRTGIGVNANIAVSGGNDRGTYYISGGYTDQQSYIINQDYKRYQGRVRFDQHMSQQFTIGTDINLTYAYNNALNAQTIYRDAILKSPNQSVYNPDGTYNWGKGTNPIGPSSDLNPVGTARADKNYTTDTRVLGNVYAEFKPVSWLALKSEFGVDWINTTAYSRQISKPQTVGGVGNQTTEPLRKMVTNNTITINKTLGGKSNINSVIGQSFETSDESTNTIWGRGFLNNNILSINAATQKGIQTSLEQQWALVSFFGRLDYQYDQKYLAGVTYRLDGSSKFAANHRYVGFPSFSAGWVVNRESFMKHFTMIDELKLRGSLGFTGSDGGAGYYGNQGQYVLNVYGATYGNLPVLNVSQPVNPNLLWEKTKTYNLGLDLSLWQSRLGVVFDYYNKTINNAILPSALPGFMGFTSQVQNLADLSNRGLELTLNTQNIVTKDLRWTTNFTISRNRDIILRLHKIDQADLALQIEQNGGRYWLQGHSATEFFLYRWGGVDPKTGNPVWVGADGKPSQAPFPIAKDAQGNYLSTEQYLSNRVPMGDAMPKFYGGFGNDLTWKGLELNIFFSYSYGNKMYNGSKATLYNYTQASYSNASINNLSPDLLGYWKTPGQQTSIPAIINASNYANPAYGTSFDYTLGRDISRFLEDASYIKLRSLTLAYNLPASAMRSMKFIHNARVYVQGDNLLIITKYSGIDPEVSAYGSSALNAGFDELTMPAARSFTVGIKLGM